MKGGVLRAAVRVSAGTILLLILAATIGIPAGGRGEAGAEEKGGPVMEESRDERPWLHSSGGMEPPQGNR